MLLDVDLRADPETAPLADLSAGALWLVAQDWFGTVLAGRPILAAPRSSRQWGEFEELLAAWYVHGDVERGVAGFRSTEHGRAAHRALARVARR